MLLSGIFGKLRRPGSGQHLNMEIRYLFLKLSLRAGVIRPSQPFVSCFTAVKEATTEHKHIELKAATGEPVIRGTNVTVRGIAELWLEGAQPEEIQLHVPQVTLAQVFDALSYYNDHKEKIDSLIRANAIPKGLSGTSLS
jgi:uncharacterized protein (DUF433 family)